MDIKTESDKETAAKFLYEWEVRISSLKRGGHDDKYLEAVDLLFDGREFTLFLQP